MNVLARGVTPDLAFDTFGYTTTAAIFEQAGVTPEEYGQELDIEKVVAAEPDVSVGVSLPTTVVQQETLEKLAPTAILEYTADWRTALRDTAKVLGREDRAAQIEAQIDARWRRPPSVRSEAASRCRSPHRNSTTHSATP